MNLVTFPSAEVHTPLHTSNLIPSLEWSFLDVLGQNKISKVFLGALFPWVRYHDPYIP